MTVDKTEPLKRFLAELQKESDRGLALIGASFLEERLASTLEAFFVKDTPPALIHGANAALAAFSSRIDLCLALGLIEELERHELHCIRKIRNEFAHNVLAASFALPKIAGLCSNLKLEMPEPDNAVSSRARFGNSVVTVAIRLLYRDIYVQRERRTAKQWIDPAEVRWRRVTEEKPPAGTSVIGAWWPDGMFGEWKV